MSSNPRLCLKPFEEQRLEFKGKVLLFKDSLVIDIWKGRSTPVLIKEVRCEDKQIEMDHVWIHLMPEDVDGLKIGDNIEFSAIVRKYVKGDADVGYSPQYGLYETEDVLTDKIKQDIKEQMESSVKLHKRKSVMVKPKWVKA